MVKIYSKRLSDRRVVTTDGEVIGTLYNITIDMRTGYLVDLVVKTGKDVHISGNTTKDGFILLPFECVRGVQEFIAIDKKEVHRS